MKVTGLLRTAIQSEDEELRLRFHVLYELKRGCKLLLFSTFRGLHVPNYEKQSALSKIIMNFYNSAAYSMQEKDEVTKG